jgi:hypothetical protein
VSLQPRRLTRAIIYRIDGLGDGCNYARWAYAGHVGGTVTFHGPSNDQVVLDVGRLYEVATGHLHYASAS